MPARPTQYSLLACLFLVLLRVSIGWQFLYEGIWKLKTQGTSKPWTSEGYLANAKGPFRDYFRGMCDDPDGLKKLDYDAQIARLDDWRNRFTQYYGLTEDQQSRLNLLLDGAGEFRARLDALPEGVDLAKFKPLGKYKTGVDKPVIAYDAKRKLLTSNFRLVGEEKEALLALAGTPATEPAADGAPPAEGSTLTPAQLAAWGKAVDRLYEESGKLGLKERLQVWLKEDPARLGQEVNGRKERIGEVEVYRQMLDRYNTEWATARTDYQFEHQDKRYSKLMEKKAEVLGPIDGAVKEFETKAYALLDVKQNQKGPLPPRMTQLRQVDLTTMWLLTILGILLIVGLFSRLAALAGAALMVLFYLPMPPWPGVPEAPGPEHSLFVNKNLIEALALLAIASLPTGKWLGLDALVAKLFSRTPSTGT